VKAVFMRKGGGRPGSGSLREGKMKKEHPGGVPDKTVAAVCGLYCEACRWYIATVEDPELLRRLAAQRCVSEEEARCHGCRSDRRLYYCATCRMSACAAERGIDFCGDCGEFPCDELKRFQAEMPHRIEIFANLERIRAVGWRQWLREIRGCYACPACGTLNTAYDRKCRKCGQTPSCRYRAEHRPAIERYFNKG